MDGERTPDAVFGLLSEPTRVDILRVVAVAQSELEPFDSGPAELAFSEIYERVDVENTSKFSYHLGELAGTFLEKSEAGYSFTYAGEQMVRFVIAENYHSPASFGPVETEGVCPFCHGDSLEASLHEQFFAVACPDCERPVAGYFVTPAQVRSWADEDLVRAAEQTFASDYRQVRRGICPTCSGRLSTDVRDASDSPLPDADPFIVVDSCEACLRRYSAPLTYGVAYHPASVAFHWDRGIDVASMGAWKFHRHVVEESWTARREGEDGYRVVMARDGDELRVDLDDEATVTHTERVRHADGDGQR